MTRTTAYVTVILVLLCILQNVKSRKLATRNEELKANSIKTNPVDKLDFSMFVDHLIKSAKMIEKKSKAVKQQKKTVQKKKKDDDIYESNYDSLGIDETLKDQIVRSNTNTASLTLNEMERLFRASNDALDYKKKENILRSGGGLTLNRGKEQDGKLFRSLADGLSKEVSDKLIIDLEEDEDVPKLKHPFF